VRGGDRDGDGGGGRPDGHLDGVADGCGCVEVWEELSDRRAKRRAAGDD